MDLGKDVRSEDCIVMVFLVGVRYKYQENSKSRLSFAVAAQYLQSTTLTVHFTTNSPTPIESLTLSYLIYSPSTVPFASYGGVIAENSLRGLTNRDLSYLLPTHSFKSLYGISAIESTTDQQPITF